MLLRYPGGKSKMYGFVKDIVDKYELKDKSYVEPFSGGFGLGIKLLINNDISSAVINDYDRHIYCIWESVFHHTKQLIKKIRETNITVKEWYKQRDVYLSFEKHSDLEVGFSSMFLNRTNYSGILMARPIGGYEQNGKYKIDCRFNKEGIIKEIEKIAQYRDHVEIYNLDAVKLLETLKQREDKLFYNFDPPYVVKGKQLYLNAYLEKDHRKLKDSISKIKSKWIMTYDNNELVKELYKDYFLNEQILRYSVGSKRKETELFISNFYNEE